MQQPEIATPNQANNKRKTYYQAVAFLITALLYCSLHMSRTAWAYIKPSLLASDSYYSDQMLGFLDTCFLGFYAMGLYAAGWLGDRVNMKLFLGVGALLAMTGFCMFGFLEGTLRINNIFLDALFFIINGLGQATVLRFIVFLIFRVGLDALLLWEIGLMLLKED